MNKLFSDLLNVVGILLAIATLFTVIALILTTLVTIFGDNSFLFNLKQGYVIAPSVFVFIITSLLYCVTIKD